MKRRRPTIRSLLVFCLSMGAMALILGVILMWIDPSIAIETLTLQQFALTIIIQDILLIVVVAISIVAYLNKSQWLSFILQRRQRKGRKPFRRYVLSTWLCYIVAMMLIGSMMQWLGRNIPGFNGEQSLVTTFSLFQIDSWWHYLLMFVLVAGLGPLVEEVVYRSYLTEILSRHHTRFGVVGGAAIFALSHLEPEVMLNLFILGLLLGYIYHRTQSGRYSFLFHLIINGVSLVVLFLSQYYGWVV